jgi:hypothetical protein
MFQPGEINQMERELCAHLEYNLHVTQDQLAVLEEYLRAQRFTFVSNPAGAQMPETPGPRQLSSSRAVLRTTLGLLQCHPCFPVHVSSRMG